MKIWVRCADRIVKPWVILLTLEYAVLVIFIPLDVQKLSPLENILRVPSTSHSAQSTKLSDQPHPNFFFFGGGG